MTTSTPNRVLIANRGEIAVRIGRAVTDLGWQAVGVHSQDDVGAAHTRLVKEQIGLAGTGPAAYLDIDSLIRAAQDAECSLVHPGYGFVAESAAFATACADAGLVFVGPAPETLDLFGNKAAARELAASLGIPVTPGLPGPVSLDEATAFLAEVNAPIMIKAIAGGGGRGMRAVATPDELEAAWARCASEAAAAFGSGDLYVEQMVTSARHIEVQVVGDGSTWTHLGERECSLQRQHQKIVEFAPSPNLGDPLRERLCAAALELAEAADLRSLATVEFLVGDVADGVDFAFIETNPRLQVEHTVTEEITGVDLVRAQLRLAAGESLAAVGLASGAIARGAAIQLRIATESMQEDGSARPTGGTFTTVRLPGGPGVRVDSAIGVGDTTNPRYDSLVAKVITSSGDGFAAAKTRAQRAVAEMHLDGVQTNVEFLHALLVHPGFDTAHTDFVSRHAPELVAASTPQRHEDPLAVLRHQGGPSAVAPGGQQPHAIVPDGFDGVLAPLQGTVIQLDVSVGDPVPAGARVAVMEAMKMEHEIRAAVSGIVRSIDAAVGDAIFEGHPILTMEPAEVAGSATDEAGVVDPHHIRPDLQESIDRHALGLDAARPEAVARRHGRGHRTARENLADLVDPGSFREYSPLMIAAQRRRRDLEDLQANTPGDGLVGGVGSVNGNLFTGRAAQAVVASYDYMVLAGTQGLQNHRKKDRLFEIAHAQRLPVVLFAEGGGGRPGDTDGLGGSGLDCLAFVLFAELSGLVPLVGITNGYCFAGNAALLGCCDVVIATEGSNIGMGGPAMIEGGGLGVFHPNEVGPMDVQVPNGVVDILVADEEAAVAAAKRYLSYFQGSLADWECADQRLLRSVIPENRLRIYDIRAVIDLLADQGSVLELRRDFGLGMVTALARMEGQPVGIIANNPAHLAGAIDAPAADKAARFMQLCDAHDIPIVFLCDTPGFMVGPEAEREAQVRRVSRMFVVGASMTVPFMTVVLRKGYGLGAQSMTGGSFKAPLFTVAWADGRVRGDGPGGRRQTRLSQGTGSGEGSRRA